jgi:hypothetical protein
VPFWKGRYVIVDQPARFLISNLSACAVRCVAVQCVLCCVPDATSSPPCRSTVSISAVCRLLSPLPLTDCLLLACLSHPPSPPHAIAAVCALYVHARHTAAAPFHAISAPSSLAYPPLPRPLPNSLSIANPLPQRAQRPCHLLARTSFLPSAPRAQESVGAAWLDLAHVRRPPGLPPRIYQSTPPRLAALLRPSSAGTWKKSRLSLSPTYSCCTCSV